MSQPVLDGPMVDVSGIFHLSTIGQAYVWRYRRISDYTK